MKTPFLQTVVLIDDSDIDNFANRLLLERSGHFGAIEAFTYAGDALTYLGSETRPQVDLILLDLNMPRMNGEEFLVAYETLPEAKKSTAIVVMLTSSTASKDREVTKRFQGLSEFRNKPLTMQMLEEIIETNFGERRV